MIEEQKHAFKQILGYIRAERPGAVLIAGDLYDRAVPGVDAVRVFDDFITELAGENIAVLIISGNHDSPERVNYASRLLSDKGLFFYSAFDGAPRKITLDDEYGKVNFWLLPFIKPASVYGIYSDGPSVPQGGTDGPPLCPVAGALEAAGIDYTGRNVLVSHQFYTKAGVTAVRSESELDPVGGLDAVDAMLIERFDYAALGHLHGSQCAGAENVRYCGSPVKYSFSEWRQEKSACLVELGEKGNLTVKPLPLTPIHDMREIKGELHKLISDEVAALADRNDYLRVILTDEEEIVDALGKLRSVYPNIMGLAFENTRTSVDITSMLSDQKTPEKLSYYDLFSEFFLKSQGSVMNPAQAAIVRELLETEGGV